MDLATVIPAVRRGDQAAFTALVLNYQEMAFGYAFALLGDFHLAQDVVQEAFVIAFFGLDRLQSPDAFPQWLRGIVRFQSGRILRKRHTASLPLEHAHDLADTALPPDAVALTRETRDHLLAAINALPEAQRVVLVLFYMVGFSQQEVATFLQLPVTTVNNRLHAARTRIKGRLLTMAKDLFADHGLPADFATNVGSVVAARGAIIDVRFAPADVPLPLTRLAGAQPGAPDAEVVQLLDDNTVRCVVLAPQPIPTGTQIRNTGAPTTASVSPAAIRQLVAAERGSPQASAVLETGIKAIDLFCPYLRGGTVGVFGDARVGKVVILEELLYHLGQRTTPVSLFAFMHTADVEQSWYGKTPAASTTVQTIYLPLPDPADSAVAHSFEALDAVTYLARPLAERGIFPAIDPLSCASRALDPTIVGAEHYAVAQGVRALLQEQAVAPAAKDAASQLRAARAAKILAFCSQPFYVAEPYTGRPGQSVPLRATVEAFKGLLNGEYDDLPTEALMWCGTIDQAEARARTL